MNIDAIPPTQQDAYIQYIAQATQVKQAWEHLAAIRPQALAAAAKVAQRSATRAITMPLTAGVGQIAPYLRRLASYYFEPSPLDHSQIDSAIQVWQNLARLHLSPSSMITLKQIWLAEWEREFQDLGLNAVEVGGYLKSMSLIEQFRLAIVLDYLTEIASAEATQNQNRVLNNFLAATGLSPELYQQMANILADT